MEPTSHATPEILASTADWLVLSKPSGWLTIPGRNEGVSVLSEWAAANGAPWVVHRIDRETSGIVLFAKTPESHQRANQWFQNREVKKEYVCLAQGSPNTPILKLNAPIEGKPSLTQVEIPEEFEGHFFARAFPRTGRRHQIRIHLAEAGFPLWGDALYGGRKKIEFQGKVIEVSRVALHAAGLQLPTGERFQAPLPEDFLSWLTELRS